MSHRHPLATDALNDQTPPINGEPGITVSHEDLLVGVTAITTPLGGLHLGQTIANVPAEFG